MLAGARDRGVRQERVQIGRFTDHRRERPQLQLHLVGLLVLERHVDQRARVPLRQRLQFAPLPSSPRNEWKILARISVFNRELTRAPARSTAMHAAITRNSCCAARSAATNSPRAAWLIYSISTHHEPRHGSVSA